MRGRRQSGIESEENKDFFFIMSNKSNIQTFVFNLLNISFLSVHTSINVI